MVYSDKQNIHNHHIQNSFRSSLSNVLKDKDIMSMNQVKSEMIDNHILTEETKRELLNYCDDSTSHSVYLITYADLLQYVWTRIMRHIERDELCKVLNEEIKDGLCMCFTGRLTRLLNVLNGFYNDIEIQISDSEQITNIIMALKTKYINEQLKDELIKELRDRQYSETVIAEWIEYV